MKSNTLTYTMMVLLLCWACAATRHIETPPTTKDQDIRTLLQMTGAGQIGLQVLNSVVANFKSAAPQVPPEYWQKFQEQLSADDLVALVVPVYERNFTQQEIRDLITFYSTPSGQAIIAKMPIVVQESMEIGQEWGKKLTQELIKQLEEDGYLSPPET